MSNATELGPNPPHVKASPMSIPLVVSINARVALAVGTGVGQTINYVLAVR